MSVQPRQLLTWALLVALVVFEGLRGLLPAWSRVDTDFPNYLTAAKIVADGRDPRQLYNDTWFRAQMRGYGMEGRSSFSPFPPPTALVLLPLARLQPLTALRVMTVLNVLCLVGAAVLLGRALGWSVLDAAVLILLSGNAIMSCLRFGQLYIVIATFCIMGYCAWCARRPWLAGACFGLFAPIKYFPLIFPAYFTLRRQWKLGLGAALAIVAVLACSVVVLGWKIHATFLTSVLGNHLTAHIGQQDPFAAAFQSFDTLFRRLFVFDPVLNPHPLWPAPAAQVLATVLVKGAIVSAAAVAMMQLARAAPESAVAPSLGMAGLAVMLLAPATASYHFNLLWLPMGLLINHFLRAGIRGTGWFLLGAYALIGFFPYKFTYPFEGDGGLTVLAYPRLFLVAAMFTACIYATLTRLGTAQRRLVVS